jgi:hypothetical protein
MKPWMIEKIREERTREKSGVPLYLPLAEVNPTGSAPHEEGGSRDHIEIDYRV